MGLKPEGQIKRQICEFLSTQNCLFWIQESVGIWDPNRKIFLRRKSPYQRKGISDILGIYQGKFLAIEVKCKGSSPSPEQKTFLQDIQINGGIAFVARSIDDVIKGLSQTGPNLVGSS